MSKNIFFTSDLHLDHKKIIAYTNRPCKDVAEMNEFIIERYNSVVGEFDNVYILGDFTFAREWEDAIEQLKRLNGFKFLIRGNHDYYLKGRRILAGKMIIPEAKTIIYERDIISKKFRTNHFVLCHYPLSEWLGIEKGWWHLHGHNHERQACRSNVWNVCVDLNNWFPVSIEEIESKLNLNLDLTKC